MWNALHARRDNTLYDSTEQDDFLRDATLTVLKPHVVNVVMRHPTDPKYVIAGAIRLHVLYGYDRLGEFKLAVLSPN